MSSILYPNMGGWILLYSESLIYYYYNWTIQIICISTGWKVSNRWRVATGYQLNGWEDNIVNARWLPTWESMKAYGFSIGPFPSSFFYIHRQAVRSVFHSVIFNEVVIVWSNTFLVRWFAFFKIVVKSWGSFFLSVKYPLHC